MQYIDIDLHELRRMLNKAKLLEHSTVQYLQHLQTDNQFAGIDWYVKRLDSIYNHYKVESHMILTKALFLMCNYQCAFSFDPDCMEVIMTFEDNKTYRINWYRPDDLMKITWVMLESSKHSDELSYAYEDFRQATRIITDFLAEDHQPRKTWNDIIKLTEVYFGGIMRK